VGSVSASLPGLRAERVIYTPTSFGFAWPSYRCTFCNLSSGPESHSPAHCHPPSPVVALCVLPCSTLPVRLTERLRQFGVALGSLVSTPSPPFLFSYSMTTCRLPAGTPPTRQVGQCCCCYCCYRSGTAVHAAPQSASVVLQCEQQRCCTVCSSNQQQYRTKPAAAAAAGAAAV